MVKKKEMSFDEIRASLFDISKMCSDVINKYHRDEEE